MVKEVINDCGSPYTAQDISFSYSGQVFLLNKEMPSETSNLIFPAQRLLSSICGEEERTLFASRNHFYPSSPSLSASRFHWGRGGHSFHPFPKSYCQHCRERLISESGSNNELRRQRKKGWQDMFVLPSSFQQFIVIRNTLQGKGMSESGFG